MIRITGSVSIDENEVKVEFVRSGGPGGQNVNKVSTAAQLRFDIPASSLAAPVKERLKRLSGKRLTHEGVLIITSRRHRTQEENRRDAFEKLGELIRAALTRPKARIRTKATASSREKRLESKHKRAAAKKRRRPPGEE